MEFLKKLFFDFKLSRLKHVYSTLRGVAALLVVIAAALTAIVIVIIRRHANSIKNQSANRSTVGGDDTNRSGAESGCF